MWLVQLNLIPGRKGLRTVLGDVPSWVAFQDKEKVEVSHKYHIQNKYQVAPEQQCPFSSTIFEWQASAHFNAIHILCCVAVKCYGVLDLAASALKFMAEGRVSPDID